MGVIADQGIQAERAWRVPLDLQRRLGPIDPIRMAANPSATARAVNQSPKLHRFPAKVSAWLTAAASVVAQHYHGDAAKVWSDNPDVRDLQDRLREFQGIGQKKAAMAVELLARELQVPIRSLERGDVAYDIHIRRVFLRTNLAQRDDPDHILAVPRRLYPRRPGALDHPAWLIGRQWCHAGTPDCTACPISKACPRLIYTAVGVRGA
jgi:endonuclease III